MKQIYYYQTEQFIVVIWAVDKNINNRKMYKNFLQKELKSICKEENVQLSYTDKGKPLIHSEKYKSISVSHTLNFLSVQLHKENYAGIDIETMRDSLIKVKSKFLEDKELMIANDDLNTLCLLWTCKEAMFKIYGEDGISLKHNIRIFEINLPYISADISYRNIKEKYTLYSQYIEPLMLTYVVKKN